MVESSSLCCCSSSTCYFSCSTFCSSNWNWREVASHALSYFHAGRCALLLRLGAFNSGPDFNVLSRRETHTGSLLGALFQPFLFRLLTKVLGGSDLELSLTWSLNSLGSLELEIFCSYGQSRSHLNSLGRCPQLGPRQAGRCWSTFAKEEERCRFQSETKTKPTMKTGERVSTVGIDEHHTSL